MRSSIKRSPTPCESSWYCVEPENRRSPRAAGLRRLSFRRVRSNSPRAKCRTTPLVESIGVGLGGKVPEVGDRNARRCSASRGSPWNACPRAGRQGRRAERREDDCRRLAIAVDPLQRVPRGVERARCITRMLQHECRKGLPMAAAPWLASRMIQGEQLRKPRRTGILTHGVFGAAFVASMRRHRVHGSSGARAGA
jgi:hypothetical protein